MRTNLRFKFITISLLGGAILLTTLFQNCGKSSQLASTATSLNTSSPNDIVRKQPINAEPTNLDLMGLLNNFTVCEGNAATNQAKLDCMRAELVDNAKQKGCLEGDSQCTLTEAACDHNSPFAPNPSQAISYCRTTIINSGVSAATLDGMGAIDLADTLNGQCLYPLYRCVVSAQK